MATPIKHFAVCDCCPNIAHWVEHDLELCDECVPLPDDDPDGVVTYDDLIVAQHQAMLDDQDKYQEYVDWANCPFGAKGEWLTER